MILARCRESCLPSIPPCLVLDWVTIHSSDRGSTRSLPVHNDLHLTIQWPVLTASPLEVLLPGNRLRSTHPPFPKSLKYCSFHKLQRLSNTQVPGCFALLCSNIRFSFPVLFFLWKDLVVPQSHSKPRPSMGLVFLYLGLVQKYSDGGGVGKIFSAFNYPFLRIDRIILKHLQYRTPNDSICYICAQIVGGSQISSSPTVLHDYIFRHHPGCVAVHSAEASLGAEVRWFFLRFHS